MPVFKYFAVVGSTLFVFLFISNAYLTDDESNLRFDGSLYASALYAPRVEGNPDHRGASLYPRRHACRSRQGSVCRIRPQ
ncbi:hypothetical protein V1293_006400 [Bradyrhizobium sp. AZCC 1693]